MSFDLNDADPAWLARVPSLPEILEAVNNVDEWSSRLARALDFAYRVRVTLTFMCHSSTEDMEELALHLEEVAHHPRREAIFESMRVPYASRWRVMREILEGRIQARGEAIPETVIKRHHMRDILEKISDGTRIPHQLLADDLGLDPSNLSRILWLMAGWEVISWDRVKNTVDLGSRAGEVIKLPHIPAES